MEIACSPTTMHIFVHRILDSCSISYSSVYNSFNSSFCNDAKSLSSSSHLTVHTLSQSRMESKFHNPEIILFCHDDKRLFVQLIGLSWISARMRWAWQIRIVLIRAFMIVQRQMAREWGRKNCLILWSSIVHDSAQNFTLNNARIINC